MIAYGPQVNVRKEFIENMSNRVTVMSSYDTPISEDSERAIFAIEAKDEKAPGQDARKMDGQRDEDVKRHQVGQYVIYERVPIGHVGAGRVPGFSTVARAATRNRSAKSGERSGCCRTRP